MAEKVSRWKKLVTLLVLGNEIASGPLVQTPQDQQRPTPTPRAQVAAVQQYRRQHSKYAGTNMRQTVRQDPPLSNNNGPDDPDSGDPPEREAALGFKRKRWRESRSDDELQRGIDETERGATPKANEYHLINPQDPNLSTLHTPRAGEFFLKDQRNPYVSPVAEAIARYADSQEHVRQKSLLPQQTKIHTDGPGDTGKASDYRVFSKKELEGMYNAVQRDEKSVKKSMTTLQQHVGRFVTPSTRELAQRLPEAERMLAELFKPAKELIQSGAANALSVSELGRMLSRTQRDADDITRVLYDGLGPTTSIRPEPTGMCEAVKDIVDGRSPALPDFQPKGRGLDV